MSHKRHDRCKCVDRESERCKALLCKLEEEYCRKKCALKDAIKDAECRVEALKCELRELEKCYEKERKAIKRECERRC